MVRCLIVDDSPCFLSAARCLLEREGVTVVGVASTGAEATERVAELRPDVVLMDVELGPESGVEVAARLHRQAAGGAPRTILISARADQDCAQLVAASSAIGFLCKTRLSAAAIRALLDGEHDGCPGDG
ncbi:response regulator transcription factor [Streptomyces sp. NPDC015171]|uniref:response regulator transcription factor n=1 Tax=Streptomyces sp. NPDC015171 TaxID=3364945 RepID=UPI0036FD7EDA